MKYTTQQFEKMFEQALEQFPHPSLHSTGITQGELEVKPNGAVEYSEEYMFDAGQVLDEPLTGGGWIELRREPGEAVTITGFFNIVRDGDWRSGSIFHHHQAVHGVFDLEKREWELWIDLY